MADKKSTLIIAAKDQTGPAVRSVRSGLAGLTTAARSVMGAFAAVGAGAAFTALMQGAARAAELAVASQQRLANAIKSTGGAAGVTAEQVERLSQAMAANTGFDDESIRDSAATLLTFRNVHKETFEEAIRLTADYAKFMGTDLQSATVQVGKALNDPLIGITALNRAGVTFSETQKEQIRLFWEQGEAAKAQGIILDELAAQFGGAAEAMNTGYAKATSDTRKAWIDFLEALGRTEAVSGPVIASLGGITRALKAMESAMTGPVPFSADELLAGYEDARRRVEAYRERYGDRFLPHRDAELQRALKDLKEYGDRLSQLDLQGVDIPSAPTPAAGGARTFTKDELAAFAQVGRDVAADPWIKQFETAAATRQAITEREYAIWEQMEREHQAEVDLYWTESTANWEQQHRDRQDVAERHNALLVEGSKATLDEMNEYAKEAARGMQRALADFFVDPTKADLASLGDMLKRLVAEAAAAEFLGPNGMNLGGLISGAVGKLFGGGRANGGSVSGDRLYWVGERGPELFAPGKSGTVIPNNALPAMGGGTTVQVYNNAPNSQARVERGGRGPDGRELIRVVIDEMKSAFDRGTFDGSMRNNYALSRAGR